MRLRLPVLLTAALAAALAPAVGATPATAAVTIPNPTVASLEATNGPLATATYRITNPSGYGSGTVTYPTATDSYPAVVLMPGGGGTQQNLQWMAPRVASWGFVVINLGSFGPYDSPESRGDQISAAATQLTALSGSAGNPLSGKVNGVFGVSGHSLGGGGTMVALRDDARFRSGVSLAPYYPGANFSSVAKPTFFLTCAGDTVANGDTFAKPWYNTMTRAEKLYIEVPGDHLCPMTGYGNKAKQGKYIVSFFSRWLRNDARFSPFLCGSQRDADRVDPAIVTEWTDTCPF